MILRNLVIATGLFILPYLVAGSQPADTLLLTPGRAEELFLERNLLLIAGKLNIDQAEARIIQAKAWPNPTFEIEEVNLWATAHQLGMGEELPPFGNTNRGKNQQISAQLEQIILTAGKRRKLISIEKVGRDISELYFHELLLALKYEFRNYIQEYLFNVQLRSVVKTQLEMIRKFTDGWEKQMLKGNISRMEFYRLKALELELHQEKNGIIGKITDVENKLGAMMGLHSGESFQVVYEDFLPGYSELLLLDETTLFEIASENNPGLLADRLGISLHEKMYSYERALRLPDPAVKVGYDRGGNFLLDFIGFGVAFDLPVFDRNRGNIRVAALELEKSRHLYDYSHKSLQREISSALRRFNLAAEFYGNLSRDYEDDLTGIIMNLEESYRERHISLLEFIDFMDAYKSHKIIVLEAFKNLSMSIEDLQSLAGRELL